MIRLSNRTLVSFAVMQVAFIVSLWMMFVRFAPLSTVIGPVFAFNVWGALTIIYLVKDMRRAMD